jgi:hypothetical protein
MQSSIKCPVCSEVFDRDQHLPLIIQCGHTVCKVCCTGIQRKSRAVVCPLDRKADRRDIEAIPFSLQILELIRHISAMQQTIDDLTIDKSAQGKPRAEEFLKHAQEVVEEIVQATVEIMDDGNSGRQQVHSAFSRLQTILVRDRRLDSLRLGFWLIRANNDEELRME